MYTITVMDLPVLTESNHFENLACTVYADVDVERKFSQLVLVWNDGTRIYCDEASVQVIHNMMDMGISAAELFGMLHNEGGMLEGTYKIEGNEPIICAKRDRA